GSADLHSLLRVGKSASDSDASLDSSSVNCWTLKELVGANGFEPSTSWSRTRFRSLLKSMKFCDSEEIENNAVAARLLILFETRSCEVLPQLQNHLHCPRCLRWSGLFFLKLPYAFNFFGAVHLGGTGRRRKGEHVG